MSADGGRGGFVVFGAGPHHTSTTSGRWKKTVASGTQRVAPARERKIARNATMVFLGWRFFVRGVRILGFLVRSTSFHCVLPNWQNRDSISFRPGNQVWWRARCVGRSGRRKPEAGVFHCPFHQFGTGNVLTCVLARLRNRGHMWANKPRAVSEGGVRGSQVLRWPFRG